MATGYDGYIRINTKIDSKKATSSLMTISNSMDKLDKEITDLQHKMAELGEQKIPTEEYKKLQKEIDSTSKKLETAKQKMDKFIEMNPGDSSSKSFRNLQYTIAELENELWDAQEAQKALEDSGGAFTSGAESAEYKKVAAAIEEKQKKLSVLNKRCDEYCKKQNKVQVATKNTSNFMKNFVSRLKSMMMSLLIFNQITKGFNAMVDGVKAGLQNYAKYSSSYSASVSQLLGSLETLKNALGAAFAPLIQIVIPIIDRFVNALIEAANWVGMLIASLTGSSTWTKATRQVKNYAESLNGAAESAKSLAGFDELNVLNDSKSSGDGGGSGGFVTENIPSEVTGMLENGFFGLGEALNKFITQGLEGIDWELVKAKAEQIATNIADFINGFFSDPNMAKEVGEAIAGVINAAVEFLLTLLEEIEWQQVADSCLKLLEGCFENLDYSNIAILIALGLAGMGVSHIAAKFGGWITGTLGPTLLGILTSNLGAVFAGGSMGQIAATIVTGLAGALLAGFLGFNLGKWLNENDVLGLGTWADGVAEFYAEKIEECGGNVALGILKGIGDMFLGIKEWLDENVFAPFIDGFCELFGIHSPSTVMEEKGGYIVEGLLNGIAAMPEKVMETFNKVVEKGKEFVNKLKEKLGGIITYIWGTFKTKWTNGWTSIKNTVSSIFTNMWSAIKQVINSILGGVESMANGVVGGVNTVIGALNGMQFTIPSWVPEYGGKSWGMNIPRVQEVQLPRLATGGITTGRTIAEIGEAGREAVLPLDNNTGWMDDLAAKINGGGNGRYTFVAQLDGKTIFEETVHQDEMYADTHGHSAFAY